MIISIVVGVAVGVMVGLGWYAPAAGLFATVVVSLLDAIENKK